VSVEWSISERLPPISIEGSLSGIEHEAVGATDR
jgi:hypothetical protein